MHGVLCVGLVLMATVQNAVVGQQVGYPAISRPNFDSGAEDVVIPEPYRSLGVTGFLAGWDVYLRNTVGCVRLQIWRPSVKRRSGARPSREMTTPRSFFRLYNLIGQTECYSATKNGTSVSLNIPRHLQFRVEARDVLGFQYHDTNPVPYSLLSNTPCLSIRSPDVITNYIRFLRVFEEYQFTTRTSTDGCKLYSLTARVEGEGCEHRQATRTVGTLSLTSFTEYDDQCWVVSNGLTGPSNPNTSEVRLKVEITDLGIRRSPNCLAGWIEVRAGRSSTSPLLGTACDADSAKLLFRVPADDVYIRYFRNDTVNTTRRFSAQYSVILGPEVLDNKTRVPCQQISVSDTPVFIRSPNYPEDYPADAEVCWIFTSPNKQEVVRVEVEDARLQPPGECTVNAKKNPCTHRNCFDYIEVRDGEDRSAPLLTTWCGHTGSPLVETSAGQKVLVSFFSDNAIQAKGFKIKVYSIHPETAECTHYLASNVETFFNSPNYPYYYPPNRDDCWVMRATDRRARIILKVYDSHTSDSGRTGCLDDWLEARDGPERQSQVLRRWCGGTVPETILSLGSFLRLRFVADSVQRGYGFHIGFRQVISDACPVYYVRPTLATMAPPTIRGPGPVVSCWILQAKSDRIQLFWNAPNMPGVDYPCSHEFIEVREGLSHDAPLIGRYCSFKPMPPGGVVSNGSAIFLRAVSDALPPVVPFNVSYRHMTSKHCMYYRLTEREMWIKNPQPGMTTLRPKQTATPQLPGNKPVAEPHCDRCIYSPNEDACWVVEAKEGEKVALRAVYVDLQEKSKDTGLCDTDYVEIKDGGQPEAAMLDVVCGKQLPFNLTSSGHFLYVHFRSDDSKQYRGFKFIIKALRADKCEHLEAYVWGQYLRSPGYPVSYPAGMKKCWVITSSSKQRPVQITMREFDIQPGKDFMEVYDGPDGNSPLLKRWEHRSQPSPITSTGHSLYIRFESDSQSAGKQGFFSILFRGVQIAQCKHVVVAGSYIHITSPGYPKNYVPNDYACWVATCTRPGRQIHIEVESLALEEHNLCRTDYVELRDGPAEESPVLHRWCGRMRQGTLVSTGRSVYIRFVSDSQVQDGGFKLRLSSYREEEEEEGEDGDHGSDKRDSKAGGSNVLMIVLIIIAILLALAILVFIIRVIMRRRKPPPPVLLAQPLQGVAQYSNFPPAYPGLQGAQGGATCIDTKEPNVHLDADGTTAVYSNTSEQPAETAEVGLQPNGGPA